MFLDDLLKLADAQESTVSVASTSFVDTQAGGDSYVGAFMYVRVDTAYVAAAGSPNARWKLETADDTAFSTNLTELVSTGTHLAAALTIGTEFKVRIPSRARRYIRGKQVCEGYQAEISDTDKFSAGKFDMFIVCDADVDRNLSIS